MPKIEELKNQSPEDLMALYQNLSKEIYGFKCELKLNRKLEKPHLLRKQKKDRARVLTALRQKAEKRA